jgi:hypothetical protein
MSTSSTRTNTSGRRLNRLSCPVMRIEYDSPTDVWADAVLERLEQSDQDMKSGARVVHYNPFPNKTREVHRDDWLRDAGDE